MLLGREKIEREEKSRGDGFRGKERESQREEEKEEDVVGLCW